jgi:hypothetical protein
MFALRGGRGVLKAIDEDWAWARLRLFDRRATIAHDDF